ncbi:MAG TPA: TetR/AcrR family transcriptional regulator [Mycobacteriales bacterium]|jgi:AcrR family transcriptional regulator|nr:TetR/AcrR family transcriptional regulator [Mycobacteriales bacterium]
MTSSEVRRRPGGRSAKVRSRVIAATLEVFSEAGATDLTIAEVARRANVHETSIYRRWGTRERLMLEALAEFSGDVLPVPNTGSVRGDLVAFGRALLGYASSPLGEALLRSMASSTDDDASAEVRKMFWQTRLAACQLIVERAVRRGELPEAVNPRLLLEGFIAPIHFRLLLTREAIDDSDLELLASITISASASRNLVGDQRAETHDGASADRRRKTRKAPE